MQQNDVHFFTQNYHIYVVLKMVVSRHFMNFTVTPCTATYIHWHDILLQDLAKEALCHHDVMPIYGQGTSLLIINQLLLIRYDGAR